MDRRLANAAFSAFVRQLRAEYAHLWPDEGAENGTVAGYRRKTARRGWPPCWRSHPGLCKTLAALKDWQDDIRGDQEAGRRAERWYYWDRAVADLASAHIVPIAMQCARGHVDRLTLAFADHDQEESHLRAAAAHHSRLQRGMTDGGVQL